MSAFLDALRLNLVCPRCKAMNRPTVYAIDLDRNGQASCNACGHGWVEPLLKGASKSP